MTRLQAPGSRHLRLKYRRTYAVETAQDIVRQAESSGPPYVYSCVSEAHGTTLRITRVVSSTAQPPSQRSSAIARRRVFLSWGFVLIAISRQVMLHQPSGGANGMAADIAIVAEEIIKTRARLNELYAQHTKQVSSRSLLPPTGWSDPGGKIHGYDL